MKKTALLLLALSLAVPNLHAAALSKKQRWAMRVIGIGLVGAGFVARNNEAINNQKAQDAVSNISLANRQNPAFLQQEFNAIADQSSDQKNANAWSIGKNASWGMAGLLFTTSFIPDTWIKPARNGQGVMVGYEIKMGGKEK